MFSDGIECKYIVLLCILKLIYCIGQQITTEADTNRPKSKLQNIKTQNANTKGHKIIRIRQGQI